MLERICKICYFLQNKENGNVLLAKDKVKTIEKANIIYDIQCLARIEHYVITAD